MATEEGTLIRQTKILLAENRHRIKLHDVVSAETRRVLESLTSEHFPPHGAWSNEQFVEQVGKYDRLLSGLSKVQALLGYWGEATHAQTVVLPPKRLSDTLRPEGGLVIWTTLRWYPPFFLLYAGGISAVAAGRYDNLRRLLHFTAPDPAGMRGRVTFVRAVFRGLRDAGSAFKIVPGYENHYTPLNEYVFKTLRPLVDETLLLGADYESAFDEFEVLMALEHAELCARGAAGNVSGPIGRFGWKFRAGDVESPFHLVVSDAESQGAAWPPVTAGLFGGSIERFQDIATKFGQILANRNWY